MALSDLAAEWALLRFYLYWTWRLVVLVQLLYVVLIYMLCWYEVCSSYTHCELNQQVVFSTRVLLFVLMFGPIHPKP